MVEYLIRLDDTLNLDFLQFCNRNNIGYKFRSTGFGGEHGWTLLYSTNMNKQDVTALKLLMQVNIMETT